MKKAFKILSVVLALSLIVTAFAACGGKETEKVTARVIDIELTEEQYAFGVDKNQPELLEQVNAFVKEIKENGKLDEIMKKYFGGEEPTLIESAVLDESKDQLVVATNAAFPPFEDTRGDKFIGIDMEIAKLLAEKLGKELVIQHMDFDAVCLSVGQHKCDIAMAGLTVDPDREAHVTFSDSYYQASQKLIVKSNDTRFDNCKTADDVLNVLRGFDSSVKIGYQSGTTGQQYVTNDGSYDKNALKVTGEPYDNGVLAVQNMMNGNVDFVVIDAAPADAIVASINAA